MTVTVENETEKNFDFDAKELIQNVIRKVLSVENCPYEVAVNVLLTDDEEVKIANRAFRGIDRSTDVLSFPSVDYKIPSDFSLVELHPESYLDPETDELFLGDIMISTDKAVAQAKEYGHSEKRELAFLVTHSMLHLLGYDHMEDDERKTMEEKQENILLLLGITRGVE